MISIYKKWTKILIFFLLVIPTLGKAQINELKFEQLNWIGLTSSTPNSTWGRVTINYTGFPSRQFFNLNVNGNWVVQNMGIDSIFGEGINQTVTTMFDLGIENGINVTELEYFYSITPTPISSIPLGTYLSDQVYDLDFEIGTKNCLDTGTPGSPDAPTGGNTAQVVKSATLPNIDKFINQVQGDNECGPGAVSNSLKYLQATGKLDPTLKTDIEDMKKVLEWNECGVGSNWISLKREHFKDFLKTGVIKADDIDGLSNAIKKGCDVELDLKKHVAVIVGVRQYADGRVELDIFDDDQEDNIPDDMRTAEIIDGKVDNQEIDAGFVVECPKGSGITLDNLTTSILRNQLAIQWNTTSEEDNLGMNLWCAQMQGNQFQEITQLNSELIPSKAILPNYGAVYSSTDYPYVNTNLQPGIQHCTLEDIDASGQCTLHCDQIDTVIIGEGNNLSNTELNELQAKAIALCNEHKQDGVCLEQLLAPNQ